jgi:hypothetical protein
MKKLMYRDGVRQLVEWHITKEDKKWLDARHHRARRIANGVESTLKEFSRLCLLGMEKLCAKDMVRLRKSLREYINENAPNNWFDDVSFALLLSKKMQEKQEAELQTTLAGLSYQPVRSAVGER